MTPAVGYTEMRDSGFPDIGSVPSAWTIMKVKHIFDVICGATPKENPENWDGNIPWIGPSDMPMTGTIEHGKRFISELGYASCGTTLVPQNSIIISTRAPIGKICIAANRLCTNQGCKALVPRNKSINNRFFAYYLRSIIERLEVDGTGTTFKELSTSKLLNEPLIAPPISEQSAIAAYLDSQCAKIDEIIAEVKASIEDYKQWKASIIYEAVTKGLDPNVEMKDSGIEWIGEIPKRWNTIRLKWLLSNPLQYGASETGVPYNAALPRYIRITDISMEGKLKNTEMLSLSEESATGYILSDEDILFARSGATVGKAFFYKKEYGRAAFAGYMIRAKINRNITLPKYVYFSTMSAGYERWKETTMTQATIQNISAARYNEYVIPVPSLKEQIEIVQFVERMNKKINELISDKSKLIANLDTYKKSLIYEVVTGKRRVI